MSISEELREYLLQNGASDVGFFTCPDGAMEYGVSIAVRLSPEIIAEIDEAPTHTYFNHYRTVNAFIDRLLLQAGLFLQSRGYGYITVAASQSINKDGWNYSGRYSHKKGACLAAGLACVLVAVIVTFIKKIFVVVREENSPFSKKAMKQIKTGFIVMTIAALLTMSLGVAIVTGFILFCIYAILEYGAALQNEIDETL